tara:strand:- start:265 stop:1491 length:1227 start_codon:yes stop_codon:yes gene_type:complete
LDLNNFISAKAKRVGAGTPVESGFSNWTLPTTIDNPINLSAGIPDADSMPVQDLQNAFNSVLKASRNESLRYGGVQGFLGLRTALATKYTKSENKLYNPDQFLIANGSAGCIDLIGDAFIEPDDIVLVEGPTFSGSTRTILGHQADIIQIPLDNDGIQIEVVSSIISRIRSQGKRIKLLYTVCDFQNPTGTVLPTSRRTQLIDLCRANQILILEDAAYSDIYFRSPPPPSLFSIGHGSGILRVGTFSKVIATGLRVGWIQGHPDFINVLNQVKFDMGNSPLIQRALTTYMASGNLDIHLDSVRTIYNKKCQVLASSLTEHCSEYFRFSEPSGGFYLWIECLSGLQAPAIRELASSKGVLFPLGSSFFLNGDKDDNTHLRLAFSNASIPDLESVGPLLKTVCEESIRQP